MQKALVILSIIAFCNAASINTSSISLTKEISKASGTLAITGITDCGVATLQDVRLNGCTSIPCQLSPGGQNTLTVDFRPRDFHWDLRHRAIIIKEMQLFELSEGVLQDSTVEQGQLYNFEYPFQTPSGVSGDSEFRIIVEQNWVQEICLIISLNVA